MEKVLITPLSHSLGVSIPRPSDSRSTVPLALLRSEGLFSAPEILSPSLLRDGSTLTGPRSARDPGSESQQTGPTNVTLSFSFSSGEKGIITYPGKAVGNDRLHVHHQAHE